MVASAKNSWIDVVLAQDIPGFSVMEAATLGVEAVDDSSLL
jgi:hypothetical protein